MKNNHYIYAWKEQGIANSGVPFYIGQGKHEYIHGKSKYHRAYAKHLDNRQSGRISYSQKKANKLARLGTPHVVEILYDDITLEQANEIEKTLIARLGRKINNTGILYNISEGGDMNPMYDPLVIAKHNKAIHTKDYIEKQSLESKNRFSDPIKKAEWLAKFNTPEIREKMKQKQAELCGIKIIYNGIEYRSKKELARFLGYSSQLLAFRLKRDIPLDLIPSKSNRRNKEF